MEIKTLNVSGIKEAMYAMRHPFQSYDRSDSHELKEESGPVFVVGEKDKELSVKLAGAGTEHAKHLRFIVVWADVTMPLYFYKQLDTYRAGVEKLSTSTMHKLTSRALDVKDFESDSLTSELLEHVIKELNARMSFYKTAKDLKDTEMAEAIWREIVQILPSSYLQKRTYLFSYAALRNMIKQRTGHRLREWQYFIDWCRTLPESWMLFE